MPYRIQAEWTGLAGAPYLSTFFVYADAGGTGAQDAHDAVADFLGLVDSYVTGSLTWTTLPEAVLMTTPTTVVEYEAVATTSGIGGASGEVLPTATQGLIKWQTAGLVGNRRVQGRTFVPGPTEGVNDGSGRPTAEYVNAQTANTAGLVTFGLYVASRTANEFFPVTSGQVWNQWAVLRSRRD